MLSASMMLALAAVVMFIGAVLFVIDAFKVGAGWGVAVIFIPFAAFAFLFKHWQEGRRGFFTQLAGVPFLAGAFLFVPADPGETHGLAERFRQPFEAVTGVREAAAQHSAETDSVTAPDPQTTRPVAKRGLSEELLAAKQDESRRRFTRLETIHTSLTRERAALDIGDPKAVAAFNDRVEDYTGELRRAQLEKRELLQYTPIPQ